MLLYLGLDHNASILYIFQYRIVDVYNFYIFLLHMQMFYMIYMILLHNQMFYMLHIHNEDAIDHLDNFHILDYMCIIFHHYHQHRFYIPNNQLLYHMQNFYRICMMHYLPRMNRKLIMWQRLLKSM